MRPRSAEFWTSAARLAAGGQLAARQVASASKDSGQGKGPAVRDDDELEYAVDRGAGVALDRQRAPAARRPTTRWRLAFDAVKPRPASPAGVSAREQEVAGLVAEGLSNLAIAARLQLSVRTVESRVRHVLAKVGLDNRTQLATWTRRRVQ